MVRTAIYARVSDDKRKEDGERRQDVTRQLDLLRLHVKRMELVDWKEYVDDGKSAFTEDINSRPAFKQLINDIKRRHVQQVFIEDMTRFSRNLGAGLIWLTQIAEAGGTVTSLKEGEFEVTSASGWGRSAMALFFAEWESRIRSEKVKSGMKKARDSGKSIGRPKEGFSDPLGVQNKSKPYWDSNKK